VRLGATQATLIRAAQRLEMFVGSVERRHLGRLDLEGAAVDKHFTEVVVCKKL